MRLCPEIDQARQSRSGSCRRKAAITSSVAVPMLPVAPKIATRPPERPPDSLFDGDERSVADAIPAETGAVSDKSDNESHWNGMNGPTFWLANLLAGPFV